MFNIPHSIRKLAHNANEIVPLAMPLRNKHVAEMVPRDDLRRFLQIERAYIERVMKALHARTHTEAVKIINQRLEAAGLNERLPVASFQKVMSNAAESKWSRETCNKIATGSGIPCPPELIYGKLDLTAANKHLLTEASQNGGSTGANPSSIVGGESEMRVAKEMVRALLVSTGVTALQLIGMVAEVETELEAERTAKIGLNPQAG